MDLVRCFYQEEDETNRYFCILSNEYCINDVEPCWFWKGITETRIYTTRFKTHLIRAEKAINESMNMFPLYSENWAYPVRNYGMPNDKYYAEVWLNGMDWQHNYWIIESHNWNDPQVYPLIIFEDHAHEDKFNQYDFNQLLDAICWYRRDKLWIKEQDPHYGVYGDTVWSWINVAENQEDNELYYRDGNVKMNFMMLMIFTHASQKPVRFLINRYFIPERKRKYTVSQP